MAGKFEIYNDKAGEFRFRLKAGNGQTILASEGYSTKPSCLNGVEAVKINAHDDARYDRKETFSGKPMFNLKAPSGQFLGTSELYESTASRVNGIESVKKNAPDASLYDLTSDNQKPTKQQWSRLGSISRILSELEKINNDQDSVLLFRGHSSYNYSLTPSIFRNLGWIQNEDVLFKELILRCPSDFQSTESTFQSLVKMQHYSLPTSLLDLTTNPLIALYFASGESSNNSNIDGEIVVLKIPKREIKYFDSDTVSVLANISRRPSNFTLPNITKVEDFNSHDEIKFLLHEIRKEKPYFQPTIQPEDLESVVCVKPKLDNARIIKQDGAFLLFGVNKTKVQPASVPERYIIKGDTDPIIIASDNKKKIRSQLAALGITGGSIYPEIDRVASHIKDIYSI